MSIRHIACLSMALPIILAVNQTALSQGFNGGRENLVVPDSYYVAKRCSEAQDTLKCVRDGKELLIKVDIKAAELVASKMSSLCDKEAKGEISGDLWFEQFEKLSDSLESLTYSCGQTVHGEDKAILFLPPAPKTIPTNFKAYTMFLFPSVEWSKPALEKDLRAIRSAFASFGASIGDTRAAIWFTEDRRSHLPDIRRSKEYCDRLKLSYNDGPYIVTSLKRPDEILSKVKRPDGILSNDELVVIKLDGITSDRIVKVLNILEQDLRTDAKIRKRSLIYEEIKQRLLSFADRNPDIVRELAKGAISVLVKQ